MRDLPDSMWADGIDLAFYSAVSISFCLSIFLLLILQISADKIKNIQGYFAFSANALLTVFHGSYVSKIACGTTPFANCI